MLLTAKQELDVFTKARELLARPNGWIKGEYCGVNASDEEDFESVEGLGVSDELLKADCFCTLGAARRAALDLGLPKDGSQIEDLVLAHFQTVLGDGDVADWNDDPDRTHTEVLAQFDATIANLTTKVQEVPATS